MAMNFIEIEEEDAVLYFGPIESQPPVKVEEQLAGLQTQIRQLQAKDEALTAQIAVLVAVLQRLQRCHPGM